jgi:CRP-like cAMP-binding protein
MEPPNPPGQPIGGAFHIEPGEIALALRRHAFLSGFDQAQLATLAKVAQPIQFRERDLILQAQQRPDDFYLLLEGSVSIELNKGTYVVRIESLGPGDAFGWSALLEHHDTLFDVRAREPCKILQLDGAGLLNALREDPVLAAAFLGRTLHLLASRMDATEMRLAEFCGVRIVKEELDSVRATVRTLNKLIEICLDGELGYRTAAEHLQDPKLRIVFKDHANRRAQYAAELRAEVERLGGRAGHSGSSLLPETRLIIEAQWHAIDYTREWLREIHQEGASGS